MNLLLAEDEIALSRAVTYILEKNNYNVDTAHDGIDALSHLEDNSYDGIILDIMMPKLDGISVLSRLRKAGNSTPVLLLTAKAETDDKVLGLDAGANDYLTKPFAVDDLLARIRAMIRTPIMKSNSKYHMGNITLDGSTFELTSPTGSFRLANKEFQVMELLMRSQKKPVPAERFMEQIWNSDSQAENKVVWVYTSYLKKKLSALHADINITSDTDNSYILEAMS